MRGMNNGGPSGYPRTSNVEKISFQMRTGVPYRRNGGAPVTKKWLGKMNWWKPNHRRNQK